MPGSYGSGKVKVENGRLSEPYPIKTRADINRARVLPTPKPTASDPTADHPARRAGHDLALKATKRPKPADDTDQPASGFDYVVKRNRMLKRISSRGGARSGTRRA